MRKRMKPETKRYIVGGIAVFLAVLMLLGAIAPFLVRAAGPALTIQAELGLGGMYKLNTPTGLRVKLANDGENFEGSVEVKINVSPYAGTAEYYLYSYPVSLAQGSAKQLDMEISIPSLIRELSVQAVDKSSKLVAETVITLIPLNDSALMSTALTELEGSLDFIRGAKYIDSYYGGERELGENFYYLDESSAVFSNETITNFDFIFIDSYDTRRLDDAQQSVLVSWLAGGGRLIIGGGDSFNKAEGGLPFLSGMEDTSGKAYARTQYDAGVVFVFSGELARLDKSAREELFNLIMNESASMSTYNGYGYGYGYQNFISNLPNLDTGMENVIFVVIFIYVLLLCPAVYFTLKRKGRRELGFVVIPALAIVISAVILALSFTTLYQNPIVNSVNVISLADSSPAGQAVIYAGAFSPSSGDLRLNSNDGTAFRALYDNNNSYYYGYNNNTSAQREGGVLMKLSFGAEPQAVFYNKARWEGGQFELRKTVDMGGGLHAELRLEKDRITGKVYNNSNLFFDELIVSYNSGYSVIFEDVEPGRELDVEIMLDGTHYPRTLMDTMPYYWNTGSPEEQRVMNIKRNVLSIASGGQDRYYGASWSSSYGSGAGQTAVRPMGYTVYAFNSGTIINGSVLVNGKTPNEYATNLFVMEGELVVDRELGVKLPFGYIKPQSYKNGFIGEQYYGYDYIYLRDMASDIVEIDYSLPSSIAVDGLYFMLHSGADGENFGMIDTVYIYDFIAGEYTEYENIGDFSEELKFDEGRYMSNERLVRLKLKLIPGFKTELRFPEISVGLK